MFTLFYLEVSGWHGLGGCLLFPKLPGFSGQFRPLGSHQIFQNAPLLRREALTSQGLVNRIHHLLVGPTLALEILGVRRWNADDLRSPALAFLLKEDTVSGFVLAKLAPDLHKDEAILG